MSILNKLKNIGNGNSVSISVLCTDSINKSALSFPVTATITANDKPVKVKSLDFQFNAAMRKNSAVIDLTNPGSISVETADPDGFSTNIPFSTLARELTKSEFSLLPGESKQVNVTFTRKDHRPLTIWPRSFFFGLTKSIDKRHEDRKHKEDEPDIRYWVSVLARVEGQARYSSSMKQITIINDLKS